MFSNGDDISAVDLISDIEKLSKLHKFINKENYLRILGYLISSMDYASDEGEVNSILDCLFEMAIN